MQINEIFHSHQGEGIFSLVPMNFIRLAGCNLYPNGCIYCDTEYARDPTSGRKMTIDEVLEESARIRGSSACQWYCITGGEPLYQVGELKELVYAIRPSNMGSDARRIEIETNGTLPPPKWFSLVDSWVVDIKAPSSGITSSAWSSWKSLMRSCDQVKFVVSDLSDLGFVQRWLLHNPLVGSEVLVSPVTPHDESWKEEVVSFSLKENIRLSLQLHKLLEVK